MDYIFFSLVQVCRHVCISRRSLTCSRRSSTPVMQHEKALWSCVKRSTCRRFSPLGWDQIATKLGWEVHPNFIDFSFHRQNHHTYNYITNSYKFGRTKTFLAVPDKYNQIHLCTKSSKSKRQFLEEKLCFQNMFNVHVKIPGCHVAN